MKLALELDATVVSPGASVSGRVRVEEGGSCRRLIVELVYEETTTGAYRKARGSTIRVSPPPIHEGDMTTGAVLPFSVQLPEDALPNQSSSHGHVTWTVCARCDRRGSDVVVKQPLEMHGTPG
jgi:hypothetical protein